MCNSNHSLDAEIADFWIMKAFEPVLADFGTAAIRNEANADFASHHFQTFAGTLFFMAPEVKESQNGGGYSTLADVWSLGVLMLLFFIGTRNINPKANIEQLLQQHKGSMSREFFELLTDMLRPKPTERISWDRLVTHPWFKFPADHAFTLLEAQEAHEKIDALKRPADVEARHIKFGAVSRIPLATRGAHRSANASQYEFTSEEMLNAVSLDSEDGIVYCGLLEARELALNMEVKLRRLHEEWTLDKQKFYDTWLAPLHRRRGELDLTLSTYETFRAIATQRTLLKFAMAYQGNTRLILALEVAKVSMEKLRQISAQQGASGAHVRTNSGPNLASQQIASPSMQGSHIAQATGSHAQSTPLLNLSGTGANAATQIAAPSPMSPSDINFIRPDLARLWEKLFESARSVMRSHNVRDSEEDSNSPISLLGQGSDFPFFVIAHATCKLLYKECIDWLLPILDPSSAISNDLKDEDEEFLRRFTGASSPVPGPKPTPKTLEDVILRLKEIRLVMEYVRHVLPKNLSGAIHSQLSGSSLQFGNQSLLNSHLIIGSGTSTGTGGAKRSSTSYSGNSSSGFTSSPLGTSADLLSAADNERICLELIESLSKVIQRLPEEMKLLADNVVKQ